MKVKMTIIFVAMALMFSPTAPYSLTATVNAETGDGDISEAKEEPTHSIPDLAPAGQGINDIEPPENIIPVNNPVTNPVILNQNPSQQNENVTIMSLLDIIKKGGIVGYLIIFLSVISLGLIIDYLVTIRKSKILPPKDFNELKELISNGNLNSNHKKMDNMDNKRASFLTRVTLSGLKEAHRGHRSMVKAMEDAGEAMTSGIARKIEHLNVIGNISPMMGLLGTVIGMLRCFNEIANMPGAIEPKQLAGGIFEALITTCMGLIVAIPSLYGYAVFRNRVDEFTGEAALAAEQLVSSYKSDQTEE